MKDDDIIMDLDSYKDMLIGGLNDHEEVEKEVEEMRAAKVGTLKPNCWKKIDNDKYIIFTM